MKDEPPQSSAVLVLADADDVGASRLTSRLSERLDVTWWRFGLPESAVSVDVDNRGFRLDQPGASLSSADLLGAPIVIYRRRLLQPRPLVVSELPAPEDREFAEREWTSLLDGLLLTAQRNSRATWLNSPSATLLTNNKLALFLFAAQAGLRVPGFSVSTPVRFPPDPPHGLVTKAISSDEQIDAARYFSTALITDEDLQSLPGEHVPAPALIQEYVPPDAELRVFYALGEFLALSLTPSEEHVDIRHTPRADLSSRAYELSPELRRMLAELAGEFDLGYCTFDLIVPVDGSPVLVDITPNGDWDYFESDEAPVVTGFLVDTITNHESLV